MPDDTSERAAARAAHPRSDAAEVSAAAARLRPRELGWQSASVLSKDADGADEAADGARAQPGARESGRGDADGDPRRHAPQPAPTHPARAAPRGADPAPALGGARDSERRARAERRRVVERVAAAARVGNGTERRVLGGDAAASAGETHLQVPPGWCCVAWSCAVRQDGEWCVSQEWPVEEDGCNTQGNNLMVVATPVLHKIHNPAPEHGTQALASSSSNASARADGSGGEEETEKEEEEGESDSKGGDSGPEAVDRAVENALRRAKAVDLELELQLK
eukprot:2075062-Rhodomonas_salina.2